MKKKSLKPIEVDATFRFKCPDINCGFDYWLSLKQCQTKNFKVVCDCGLVFKPKQMKSVKIVYKNKKSLIKSKSRSQETKSIPSEPNNEVKTPQTIPENYKVSCAKIIEKYGFTEIEAFSLLEKAYSINPINETSSLVKYILENINILENK
jgi:hypothetical protein